MIRRAAAADEGAVAALTRAAYAQYRAVLDADPIPVTEAYGPRIARGEVWLLEEPAGGTDAPAGLIVLERRADHLLIFSVAVHPAHQGRGHGLRLLRFADETAGAAGLAEIRLYTNARMTRNIALYTRYGYRETGRQMNPARPGWVRVDMARALDGPAA
jgi:ribosomal protein S18 acetylase RimI-like enzyme